MSVSIKTMIVVLHHAAQVLPPPPNLQTLDDIKYAAPIWVHVLGDHFDDSSISQAALYLARTLRTFPVPADFLALSKTTVGDFEM